MVRYKVLREVLLEDPPSTFRILVLRLSTFQDRRN